MHTTGHDRRTSWNETHNEIHNETEWEFKIVRARNREFGRREHLDALLHQEALAGWIMTDKYNDSQVRFRRHRSARNNDFRLPPHIDPYRTIYNPHGDLGEQNLHLVVLVIILAVALGAMVLLAILVSLPT